MEHPTKMDDDWGYPYDSGSLHVENHGENQSFDINCRSFSMERHEFSISIVYVVNPDDHDAHP